MRPPWKLIGLAGVAGVAATGVVLARRRRDQGAYDAEEVRDRLHRRLADVIPLGEDEEARSPDSGP
jgi:hypothetical protein